MKLFRHVKAVLGAIGARTLAVGALALLGFAPTTYAGDTYYVLSGNTVSTGNQTHTGLITIENGTDNTIYVAPGSIIRFRRPDDYSAALEISRYKYWKWNRTPPTGISGVIGMLKDIDYGGTITTDWKGNTDNKSYLATITIGNNAVPGSSVELWSSRRNSHERQGHVTIIVMSEQDISEQDIVDNIWANNQYPVYLAVLTDSSGTIPGEPGVSRLSYQFFTGSYGTGSSTFASNASGVISDQIHDGTQDGWISSVDGSNTKGVVDFSGEKTKGALAPGAVNFDSLLTAVANAGNFRASDNTIVTAGNKNNYEIIPYVIKLETSSTSLGWHIDCMVKRKSSITYTYDLNLPAGKRVEGIQTPGGGTIIEGGTVPLATINGVNSEGDRYTVDMIGKEVTALDGTVLTFRGWAMTSNASSGKAPGTTSDPITADSHIIYGVWDPVGTVGTLEVRKVVTEASGTAPGTDSFTFKLTALADNSSHTINIYSSSGNLLRSSTIAKNGTFTLQAGQYARILNVTTGAASVQETNYDSHYTPDTTAPKSTTIRGGVVSSVTFTNTYALKIFTVTGTIDHGTAANNNQTVTEGYSSQAMVFTPATGYKIITVNGVSQPVENESSYTYPAQPITENTTVVVTTAPISYTITYNLDGGSVSPANPTSYNIETATFTLNNPARTGYTFTGWTGSNGTTPQTTVTIARGSTGNRSYTANWTPKTDVSYTVHYYKQGTTVKVAEDKVVTGKTFGSTVTENAITIPGCTAVAPTSQNLTLDAYSKEIAFYYTVNTYTVTYQTAADPDWGKPADESVPGGNEYHYNDTVTVAAALTSGQFYAGLNGQQVRGAWTFSEWSQPGTFQITEDTVISGSWTFKPVVATQRATGEDLYVVAGLDAAFLAANNLNAYNVDGINTFLNEEDAHGVLRWEHLVTGTAFGEPLLTGVSQAANAAPTVGLGAAPTAENFHDLGYKVSYELRRNALDEGGWTSGGTQAELDGALVTPVIGAGLSAAAPGAYYRLVAHIVPDAETAAANGVTGAIDNVIPTKNIAGVIRVESATENTITAVPFGDLPRDPAAAGDARTTVAHLLGTGSLAEGDQIRARYTEDGADVYMIYKKTGSGYAVGSPNWEPVSDFAVTPDGEAVEVPVADKAYLDRGSAVWVTRKTVTADPYYIIGQYSGGDVQVAVAGAAEGETTRARYGCTLVANPTIKPIKVNDFVWGENPSEDDTLTIPGPNGVQYNLMWINGEWGRTVLTRQGRFYVSSLKTDDVILPGMGFWYYRYEGGEPFTVTIPADTLPKE